MTPLPGVFGSVAPYLSDYGYAAVALFVLLENFGLPLPGEAILVTGAIFTVSGRLDVSILVLVAVAAAVMGDNLGYALGRFGGRSLAVRLGRRFGVSSEHLDRVDHFFSRHGGKVVVAARFLPLLRHLNGIGAGLSRMRWRRFLIANGLGAGIWVAVWTAIGTQAGAHLQAVDTVLREGTPLIAGTLVLLVVALVVRRLLRRRVRDELPVVP
ncbi:MAG: phosphoesterase PA-phosphatase related protein [Ramlibacter sp.]|nr:phosphoesterase PA-phosphatase related protein [Ramlibacter sp.]